MFVPEKFKYPPDYHDSKNFTKMLYISTLTPILWCLEVAQSMVLMIKH